MTTATPGTTGIINVVVKRVTDYTLQGHVVRQGTTEVYPFNDTGTYK